MDIVLHFNLMINHLRCKTILIEDNLSIAKYILCLYDMFI